MVSSDQPSGATHAFFSSPEKCGERKGNDKEPYLTSPKECSRDKTPKPKPKNEYFPLKFNQVDKNKNRNRQCVLPKPETSTNLEYVDDVRAAFMEKAVVFVYQLYDNHNLGCITFWQGEHNFFFEAQLLHFPSLYLN